MIPKTATSRIETDTSQAGGQRSAGLWSLLKRVHSDNKGGVSIETILIIAAIAIPILIFIIKFGWPRIKSWFTEGMDELEGGMDEAAGA